MEKEIKFSDLAVRQNEDGEIQISGSYVTAKIASEEAKGFLQWLLTKTSGVAS